MASAVESLRLFSFRAPVSPALAQPQLALRLLAGRQVDHRRLALSLVRLALRPDLDRQAAWLEVYGRQVAHALFRLAPRRDLHRQVACQVGRSRVVLALLRRDAHAHRDQLGGGVPPRSVPKALPRPCCGAFAGPPAAQVLGPGRTCFAAGHVQAAAAKLGKPAPAFSRHSRRTGCCSGSRSTPGFARSAFAPLKWCRRNTSRWSCWCRFCFW